MIHNKEWTSAFNGAPQLKIWRRQSMAPGVQCQGKKKKCNKHKLKHRRFCLNVRKHFFIVSVTEHQNKFPRASFLGVTQKLFGNVPEQVAPVKWVNGLEEMTSNVQCQLFCDFDKSKESYLNCTNFGKYSN